jgi:hypothetical protein
LAEPLIGNEPGAGDFLTEDAHIEWTIGDQPPTTRAARFERLDNDDGSTDWLISGA